MPTPRINKVFPHNTYFLTLTVIEWIDIFTKPQYFHVLARSMQFCQKERGLQVFAYVFMTNHLHFIACSEEVSLSDVVRDFKRHTTKEIKELLREDENRRYIKTLLANTYSLKKGSEFQIWQRENFAEMIQSEEMMKTKIDYIHHNPVRKEYVREPQDWKYSSARFYEIDGYKSEEEDIVVPCTTWN